MLGNVLCGVFDGCWGWAGARVSVCLLSWCTWTVRLRSRVTRCGSVVLFTLLSATSLGGDVLVLGCGLYRAWGIVTVLLCPFVFSYVLFFLCIGSGISAPLFMYLV